MAILNWSYKVCLGGVTTHQPSYDGTYIWFATRDAGGNRRLYRMRPSDKALIKPDGTVGDETNSYVTLPVWAAYCPVASNGTYVFVANTTNANYFGVYNCSDMSLVGHYSSVVGSGTGRLGDTQTLYCDGTDVYAGGSNASSGRKALFKWTSGATALTLVWTHASQSGSFSHASSDGTDIWLSGYDTVGPMKVSKAGTLLASAATTTGNVLTGGVYDAGLDSMFFGGSLIEYIQVRNSDGAYLTRAQGVDTFANAKVLNGGGDSAIPGPSEAIAVAGGNLYVGGTLNRTQRREIKSGMPGQGYWHQSTAALPNALGPGVVVGKTLFAALGFVAAAAGNGGLAWTDFDAAGANLTSVDPGTGPHISLTFDTDVGLTGPTIGPASSGLGVTGVTAISATQIDLACALRPDAPVGEADATVLTPPVGEADTLGPPVPTGVGATVL